ncbi:MAG: hypothetical protein ACQ5SW_00095, partial [Sphaerochaetaceae bacterium]
KEKKGLQGVESGTQAEAAVSVSENGTEQNQPKAPSLLYGEKQDKIDFSSLYYDEGMINKDVHTRLADMGELSAQQNMEMALPTFEEFQENHKGMNLNEEQLDGMYKGATQAYNMFRHGQYNSQRTTAGVTSDKTDSFVMDQLGLSLRKDDNKNTFHISNTDTFVNGKPVRTSTEEEVAEGLGVYKDKEGNWKSMDVDTDGYLALKSEADEEGDVRHFWQEINEDDDITNQIRSIFGPASVESGNVFASMGRGAFGQITGKTVEGIGGFIEVLGDAIDSSDQNKWSDKIGRRSANWSKYMTSMNEDEMGSAFSDWNSFFFQFGDGLAQTVQVMASAYTLGGAASLLSNSAKVVNGAAHWGSLSVAGMQKASLVRNESKRMGLDEKTSARAYVAWMAATMAAENLGVNMLTKPFGRIGAKQFRKAFSEIDSRMPGLNTASLNGLGKNLKNLEFRKANRQVLDWMENKATNNAFAASGVQFVEEWSEEGVEKILDSGTEFVLNGVALKQADLLKQKYDGVKVWTEPLTQKVDENGETTYVEIPAHYMKRGDGEAVLLSEQQFAQYQEEIKFIDKMEKQEGLYEIKPFSAFGEEGFMAGLSAAFGGAGNYLFNPDRKNQKKDKLTKLAVHLAKNPKKREDVEEVLKKMYASGEHGNTTIDFDGNVLADKDQGNSQADVNMKNIQNTLDVLVDFVDKSGFTNHETIDVVMGKNNLLSQGLDAMEAVQTYSEALQKAEAGEELEADGTFVTEEDTAETLKAKLAQSQERYNYFMTPKKNGKTSEAYSDYARFYGHINYNVRKEALRRAANDKKIAPLIKKFQKENYDRNPMEDDRIRELVEAKAEKLTP